ncbi:MAG: arginine--tRNA ligase, partial [Myxococcales bacterium]|nr:arginine--tRNA ligase [Myxococcales bacterium]
MAKSKQKKSGDKSGGNKSGNKSAQGHTPHDPEGPRLDTLARALARVLHAALPEAAGLSEDDAAGLLERPPTPDMGDFAFPCFRLARTLRKGPPVIAAELARALTEGGDPLVESAAALGPYVNIRLGLGPAGALLLPKLARGQFETPPVRDQRIMVEFSQPNTHKAFHVGHMRNLCLGDALVRLLRADGYPVIAANYFGDVGAHIAKCLWWFLDHLTEEQRQPPARHRGEWLGQIYAAASDQLSVWEEQAEAGDEQAAARLAAAKARTTEILQRLETREPEMTAVWERTRRWSLDEFAEIYKWSDVEFDALFYESQVDEPGLRLVDEFLEKGVFTVSEGAVGIFNEEIKHMPFFMLRKRDGNGLYATKDLALARMKFERHSIDRSIYVVDVRQSDHFKHVFLTLKKMGFQQADQCQHVPYEMVELPDGPMATRKGNVILFRELRERMTATIT